MADAQSASSQPATKYAEGSLSLIDVPNHGYTFTNNAYFQAPALSIKYQGGSYSDIAIIDPSGKIADLLEIRESFFLVISLGAL